MTDVYSLILEELTESKACHVDRFPPFYILSVGAHLLNLTNKRKGIYFEGRRIPDLRVHIMFNAPPGGEKTFWLEQFLRGEQAILLDSGIGIVMKGAMTEAGFVGTTKFENGEKVVVPGICKTHMSDIVGIEEFAAVTQALTQEHSRALDPALLGALDSGWVYKDLAAGSISYETRLSLWAASVHPASPVIIRKDGLIDILPICDARFSSEILTRNGFRKLRGTYSHPFKGQLKLVNAHGSTILITDNHAVFDVNGELTTYQTKTLEIQSLKQLDNREITVDEAWAGIQGFFAAEGWLSSHDIQKPWICQKDRTILDKVLALKPEIFCEPHWYEGNRIWMVRIKSEYKDLFYECYSHSGYKKVPLSILNASDNAKKAFLNYFLLGDGSKPNALWRFHQSIKHMTLAAGISYLAQGNPSTRAIEKEGNYGIEVLLGKRNRRPSEEVKHVYNVPYDGLVWDATTEDSTFVTGVGQWATVHNTQPARFDLRSGMARRFLFINNIPTLRDLAEVRLARRNSKNIRYNPVRTDRIRQEMKDLKARVEGIESITWDEETVYKRYDELKLLHWEEKLYDNMLMGYWIMRGKFDRELHVTLDDTITNYILQEARHRDTIRRGSEFAEILLLMREHNGEIEEFVLKDELLAFGKDWRQSRQLIDDLIHIRALVRHPNGILKLSANLRGNKAEGEKTNG